MLVVPGPAPSLDGADDARVDAGHDARAAIADHLQLAVPAARSAHTSAVGERRISERARGTTCVIRVQLSASAACELRSDRRRASRAPHAAARRRSSSRRTSRSQLDDVGGLRRLGLLDDLRRRVGVVGDDDQGADAGLEQLVGELRLAGPVTVGRLDEDVGLAILRPLDEQVTVPLPALVQRVHQQANLQPPASRRLVGRRGATTRIAPPAATAAGEHPHLTDFARMPPADPTPPGRASALARTHRSRLAPRYRPSSVRPGRGAGGSVGCMSPIVHCPARTAAGRGRQGRRLSHAPSSSAVRRW